MQLTQRAKQVDRKPMTWVESIYLWNIFKGMMITLSHLFKKKATIQYPEETRTFSKVFRGLHVLNRDEEGRERCTACDFIRLLLPASQIVSTCFFSLSKFPTPSGERLLPYHPLLR